MKALRIVSLVAGLALSLGAFGIASAQTSSLTGTVVSTTTTSPDATAPIPTSTTAPVPTTPSTGLGGEDVLNYTLLGFSALVALLALISLARSSKT